jgi:hypothetical protein
MTVVEASKVGQQQRQEFVSTDEIGKNAHEERFLLAVAGSV